jgi:hypothetical protein
MAGGTVCVGVAVFKRGVEVSSPAVVGFVDRVVKPESRAGVQACNRITKKKIVVNLDLVFISNLLQFVLIYDAVNASDLTFSRVSDANILFCGSACKTCDLDATVWW